MMELKFKLFDKACMPEKATIGAACFDLKSRELIINAETMQFKYMLGVGFEIPVGYVGLIFPRSSVAKTGLRMANCVGVIDSDYRGEVCAVFDMSNNECTDSYLKGERCCQIMFIKTEEFELIQAEELGTTERGTGGFGHTGR